jgi:hypothetical protein
MCMSALQKKLLLALSLALALQTAFVAARYVQELGVGERFGGDFICFWQAAVRARHGDFAAIYGAEQWRRVLSAQPSASLAWFVYPPFSLFGLQLLGSMSYARAVACWSVVPLPFYLLLLVAHARRSEANLARVHAQGGELGWLGCLILAGMTLPFLGANLLTGQVGAIVAVIFLAAAYFWPDRPLLSGLFIGLLAVKPQLGLLLPFALAAAGRWRTAAVAAGVVTALVAASFLWFGRELWADYVQMTGIFSRFLSLGPGRIAQLALAPYVSLRGVGLPAAAAAIAQGAISLAVLASIVAVFRRNGASLEAGGRRDPRLDLRLALLAAGALLATPYAMSYESPLLVLAVIPLFVRAWRRGWDGLELLAITGLVVTPLTQILLVDWRVPFGFCTLLFAFGVLGRRYLLEAPTRIAPEAVALPQPA